MSELRSAEVTSRGHSNTKKRREAGNAEAAAVRVSGDGVAGFDTAEL